MAFDRFLIAPSQSGLQTDLRPWLIPDDAFSLLENAYVFRGRVRKRFGSFLMGSGNAGFNLNQLTSRLRVQVGTIGAPVSPVPGTKFKIGQAFSAGSQMFTVYQANGAMLATGVGTGTFNTATGAFALAGTGLAAGIPIYWYPTEPVMGISIFEDGPANNQPTYAFDTQFAYVFAGGFWQRSGAGATPIWHGTNLNFFWTTNFRYPQTVAGVPTAIVAFFVSNFFVTNPNGAVDAVNDDPIWYLRSDTLAWTAFQPTVLTAGNFVQTARIMVQFHGRLILLNTIEVNAAGTFNANYVNRCRFSQVGDPTAANAFLEITQAGALGGGVIDAPTSEAIVTAGFVKDHLIVYFERSTRELAWTGNDVIPFEWRDIDSELGSESTFSAVQFNKEVFAIGSTGVHTCNGSNVSRFDEKIPDKIFTIKNEGAATARVAGIRDFYAEMVYWAYPSGNLAPVDQYPNKVLVFNYRNKTWAENDDCITTFGYFEQGLSLTWASSAPSTWEETEQAWESGYVQAQARQVVAGNQEGFTFLIFPDLARNAPAMQLTNATLVGQTLTLVITDHNLQESTEPFNGDYICIENCVGSTSLNGLVFAVDRVINSNTISVLVGEGFVLNNPYLGGGTITRVSNIKIRTKQWNPYDKEGGNVYVARIDFGVKKTGNGEITVDYFPSASELGMIQQGEQTGSLVGTNVLETKPYPIALYPFEQVQDRLWHPVYFQSVGECIQLSIYMNNDQMTSTPIAWSDFEIEGIILYTARAGSRLE